MLACCEVVSEPDGTQAVINTDSGLPTSAGVNVTVVVTVAVGVVMKPLVTPVVTATKGTRLNVAVTFCTAFMVTVHIPVPEQAPPQPAKVEPEVGAAVSVTLLPLL